jgi:hypothetical protein
MKRYITMTIFLVLFITSEVLAQTPGDTLWTKTFGGSALDQGWSLQQTSDGGSIITGVTESYGAGLEDILLIKTNAEGDAQWIKTFGGEQDDGGCSVQQTTDDGYIVAGYTSSSGAGSVDALLVKVDSLGNQVWQETFGSWGSDGARSVQQTFDEGFIITGWTWSYGTVMGDLWLVKIDSQGNEEWNTSFGGNGYDRGFSVQQTTDGGYVATGWTDSYGAGNDDVWLVKADSQGNEEWNKTFGGSGRDQGQSVQQTTAGGYIITGYTRSYGAGDDDVWLIKTDSLGIEDWKMTYGGVYSDVGYSVQQTTDGGFIITGHTLSYGAGVHDFFLIKADALGDTLWTRAFGGSNIDIGNSVQQTADGGYILVGYTRSYGAGNYDVWLLKIEGEGVQLNPPRNLFVTDAGYSTWDPPASRDLLGYNIFLDSVFVYFTTDLYYQYTDLTNNQTYLAGVSALYDDGESQTIEYEFTYLETSIENEILHTTILIDNYPNPFNHITTISFTTLDFDKNTEITVYNLIGQIVKQVVNEQLAPGEHSVNWDGTDDVGNEVPSGVYFYKLSDSEYYETKKMLLMR